uniref:Uncharacterized protein n=1 Tax=Meloidogyne incognita TaxID=6306 RepID=A0A914L3S0_MELIC
MIPLNFLFQFLNCLFSFFRFLTLNKLIFDHQSGVMTDIQKQPKLATKEQLRLAELLIQPGRQTLSTTDDAASQKRLKKVIELTNCTPSAAEVALIDTDGSVEAAVALLLDKPDELVLWSQQGAKARNRPVKGATGASNSGTGPTGQQQFSKSLMTSYGGSGRRGDSQRGENRFRRDGQNLFEGKQGQTGVNRQKRTPSNRNGEQQENGHADRAKSHERFGDRPFKPRGDRVNASGGATTGFRRRNNFNSAGKGDSFPKTPNDNNATSAGTWNANDNNCGEWNNNKVEEKANDASFPIGTFSPGEDAQNTTRGRNAANSKNDDWKSGPRVFMPSTLQSANTANNSIITSSVAQAPATNTSSWPSLEHNSNNLNHGTTANTSLDIQQPPKPKTFASVAASKKTQPPPPLPPPMMVMQQFNDIKPSSNAVYESSQVKQQQNCQLQHRQPAENDSMLLDVKATSGNCPSENTSVEQEWSTTVDWAVPVSPRLNSGQPVVSNANQPPHSESSAAAMAPADSFGSSAAHSITVNQEYTNQLKSAIGLMQQPQHQTNHQQQQSTMTNQQQHLTSQNSNIAQSKRLSTASSVEFFQQQMSQMHDTLAADASDFDKKVEFATGDLPPPAAANMTSNYQFGFDEKIGIPSAASLNDAWSTKHISSVEMDRSMLKNSTAANVLSTMTSIPTTSSSVTAHFSTSIHPATQHLSHDYRSQQQQQQHRNASQPGSAALSFTDTASVNYPPANNSNSGMPNVVSSVSHPPQASMVPSTTSGSSQAMQQQSQHQQLNKTTTSYYTAANQSQQQMHPSMMAAAAAAAATVSIQQQPSAASHHMPPPLTHHLQQHQPPPQAIYHHHQTSTAPPPASAVAQFPSYNMPYMYSPVATAQTIPGAPAEIDRFLLQQYGPYRGLDMQLGAMTLGPPTTLAPSHRNQLDSFMDNKFGQQQQTGML